MEASYLKGPFLVNLEEICSSFQTQIKHFLFSENLSPSLLSLLCLYCTQAHVSFMTGQFICVFSSIPNLLGCKLLEDKILSL